MPEAVAEPQLLPAAERMAAALTLDWQAAVEVVPTAPPPVPELRPTMEVRQHFAGRMRVPPDRASIRRSPECLT
jgi:hypothetical protein